jgi:protein TonB
VPSASATFAARPARPLGAPGRWVTNADYPSGALRRGEQGVAVFDVAIGADGKVRDCSVTQSSGSAELDAATCARVTSRARFAPATDTDGTATIGHYRNSIRWEIPQ